MYVSNIPLVLIWLWFALRSRRLFFFTAVNPVIETGGAWGESKYHILQRIPAKHLPKTAFIPKGADFEEIKVKFQQADLSYPVIAKPNIGERGLLVKKIKDEHELAEYAAKNNMDFLIQEFVSLPLELAVMHHRFPGETKGKVTSICIKETLKITGDGRSTIRQLMEAKPRAKLQIQRFEVENTAILNEIPAPGKTLELEPIGNHCRGTMFLNGNPHIDEAIHRIFNEVAAQMENIHYGRFDMKCTSIEDLRNGKGFLVMEYNGIGAEPAHIYDPEYPLLKKYADVYRHWKIIYEIAKIQRKRSIPSMSISEAMESLKKYAAYKKSLEV